MIVPKNTQWFALGLLLMGPACGSATPAQKTLQEPALVPLSLVPDLPERPDASAKMQCPNAVYGSHASSVLTDRGIALIFSVEDRLPITTDLTERGEYLAQTYNSLYGMEGQQTSWANAESTESGVRIDFSIITEPDLGEEIEPVSEGNEDELRQLRERITGYLVRMQQRRSCPLMLALTQQGAELPAYAQRSLRR